MKWISRCKSTNLFSNRSKKLSHFQLFFENGWVSSRFYLRKLTLTTIISTIIAHTIAKIHFSELTKFDFFWFVEPESWTPKGSRANSEKAAIKREQNKARFGYAEREQARRSQGLARRPEGESQRSGKPETWNRSAVALLDVHGIVFNFQLRTFSF